MKKLEVRFTVNATTSFVVGVLAESDRRVYFEYDPGWIAKKLELSPFHLPTGSGLLEHRGREFGPLPGLFDDSLPDGWGLLLMDRQFRKLGLEPGAVSALDRLAFLGTATMGALTYHPPAEREDAPAPVDLATLAANAREVFAGTTSEVLPQLLRAGGSPGGARPKVLIGARGDECVSGEDEIPADFEPWIVKFPAAADLDDAGPMEYAYSSMARAAGIQLPDTRLFETVARDRLFGIRRFDRVSGRRFHVHTFGNLIQANFRIPSCDYDVLLKVSRILTRDHRQVVRVLRQMIFNILAHNRDDHVKNFAFMLDDGSGEWSLTPAYDLSFAAGPGGEHTMTVSGEGKAPTREHVLKLCRAHSIDTDVADAIIDEVASAVARWREFAGLAGVESGSSDRIARSLGRLRL